jgi:2-polyprenyl-3-methyl-5-hydroxy-6-metoxy-1,4-benzoquinol methylase
MGFDNEGIRVEEVTICSWCGEQGQILYGALRDRLFGAPGTWSLFECRGCGLVWLNPRPVGEDIGKLYVQYYTHGQEPSSVSPGPRKIGSRQKAKAALLAVHYGYPNPDSTPFWNGVGRIASSIPFLRDLAGAHIRDLPFVPHGQLLDVGCGNGNFLVGLRERGWQVRGIEPDPNSARVARERNGLEVTTGTLEGSALPSASVDAITLSHVIEHVPDPVALLCECSRVLRPGGRLIAETPNIESFGHRKFGTNWRGLEVPRHLFLFSRKALRACAQKAGLKIEYLRSTSRGGRLFYMSSDVLKHGSKRPQDSYRPSRWLAYQSLAFQAWEETLRLVDGISGDVLVLSATRPTEQSS